MVAQRPGDRACALVAGQNLADLLADPVQVAAQFDQHLGGDLSRAKTRLVRLAGRSPRTLMRLGDTR